MIKLFVLLIHVAHSFTQTDYCPIPTFTPHNEVKILGNEVLIVTHPTHVYDGRRVAKPGIDKAIAWAQSKKIPTIYLWEPDPVFNPGYYPEVCTADYTIASRDGEHTLTDLPNHIISVGGRYDRSEETGCMVRTHRDIFTAWSKKTNEDLKLTIIADATYLLGIMHPDDLAFDIWRDEFRKIIEIKGEKYEMNRVLSLTEMLEILAMYEDNMDWGRKSNVAKLSFISDHLFDTGVMPPQYQIEYKVMGRKKVYRASNIKDPNVKKPTLLIEIQ
ncbi:MAG: hypothetical protein KA715_05090 [Xanthomonadaceae bacterium]|nr:hypothetical protein [Xanthomonadaceae bacterium]